MPKRNNLQKAIEAGQVESVERLVTPSRFLWMRIPPRHNPVAVDEHGWSPLHHAVQEGQLGICKLLVDRGASVNPPAGEMGEAIPPLSLALLNDNREVAEYLIDIGADVKKVDGIGMSVLHWCSTSSLTGLAEALIDAGLEVNARDMNSETPLHHAVTQDQSSMVELLLERGAHVEVKNAANDTPLHVAAKEASVRTARILLAHGADPDAWDEDGRTPLHIVAKRNLSAFAALFIARGGDVRARDFGGRTPLHAVLERGGGDLGEVVELLLMSGALVDMADKEGITPLDMGEKCRQPEIENILGLCTRDELAVNLVSDIEPVFLQALTEAVQIAQSGSWLGISAIREAIRNRSGQKEVKFFAPGLVVTASLDRYAEARERILTLAGKRALLSDTRLSGDLLSAFIQLAGDDDVAELLSEVIDCGGASESYAFQLLYNELVFTARALETKGGGPLTGGNQDGH